MGKAEAAEANNLLLLNKTASDWCVPVVFWARACVAFSTKGVDINVGVSLELDLTFVNICKHLLFPEKC